MKESVAVEVLRQVKTVLDKYGVEFWLDLGALLGAIREGKLISWDTDVDLTTWQKNTAKVAIAFQELRKQGFVLEHSRYGISIRDRNSSLTIGLWQIVGDKATIRWGGFNSSPWLGKFLSVLFWAVLAPHYSRVALKAASNLKELIYFTLARLSSFMPGRIVTYVKRIQTKFGEQTIWLVPAEYFTNLTTIDFYGMKIKAPAKTEEYLSYRYGKDWRVPRKDWVTARDDGAVFPARNYV
ncbi:LicD family protein [Candidatus Omnitrophota bacterium]